MAYATFKHKYPEYKPMTDAEAIELKGMHGGPSSHTNPHALPTGSGGTGTSSAALLTHPERSARD
eukprot:gene5302-13795_t